MPTNSILTEHSTDAGTSFYTKSHPPKVIYKFFVTESTIMPTISVPTENFTHESTFHLPNSAFTITNQFHLTALTILTTLNLPPVAVTKTKFINLATMLPRKSYSTNQFEMKIPDEYDYSMDYDNFIGKNSLKYLFQTFKII